MKILQINSSETDGGAAIAVSRLHSALLKNNAVDSWMLVKDKSNMNKNVISLKKTKINYDYLKFFLNKVFSKLNNGKNKNLHSYSIFKSNIITQINEIQPSLVNLNWVCDDLLSIEQINEIQFPIIWTMHDFWPFSGAEHYPLDTRFMNGYLSNNREVDDKFFDVDKWVWERKLKYRNKIKNIICTSQWMIEKVKKSVIFKDANIFHVPCTIDINKWSSINKVEARKKLSIPLDKDVFIFVSSNGIRDKRKNFDFIIRMLKKNFFNKKNLEIIIVGSDQKNFSFEGYEFKNFKISYQDYKLLILLYSSADLLLMPSKLEAFGQTALEAGLCNTPTIGFRETGLEDIINHKKTGYLSNNNDLEDFINGINWCLEQKNNNQFLLGDQARNYIIKNFSNEVVAKKYLEVCKKII
jgi:glycosyltransferase involved in cell wall biosynthesis